MEMVTWERLSSSDNKVYEQSGIKPRGITKGFHWQFHTHITMYIIN